MKFRCVAPFEYLVVFVVISVLASLLLPTTHGHPCIRCTSNLSQLYKLGTVYASMHKGRWPDHSGDELWLSFTRTTPPLIPTEHLEILACRARGEQLGPGETHYFGPRVPYQQLGLEEPLGGDKLGNHGEGEDGVVLFKDGRVEQVEAKFLRP